MMKKNGGFHMVLPSHVKKQSKMIAALPDEIIFHILLLIPAYILYGVTRFVCRQWNRIINDPVFVATLPRPTTIFLVQDPKSLGHFLHVRECDIDISNFKFQFPGYVLATCNGLTLVKDRRYETTRRLCYIVNPATNRMMTLPTMPLDLYRCCLAFAPSSNTYKVVVVTKDRKSTYLHPFHYQCAILTVNVDKAWRFISCADIDEFMSIFISRPIMTTGFVYWGCMTFRRILALNVDSESIKAISYPQMSFANNVEGYFLPKGNTISWIHIDRDYSIKVWVLKDHESEDWVKFPVLGFEEMRREVMNFLSPDIVSLGNYLIPISWLKNEEKIVFQRVSVPKSFVVYDVKTGGSFNFTMDINARPEREQNGLSSAIFLT